jgi:hypothetical protein
MKIQTVRLFFFALLFLGCSSESKKVNLDLKACEEKLNTVLDLSTKKTIKGKLYLDDEEATLRGMPMTCALDISRTQPWSDQGNLLEFMLYTNTIPSGNPSKPFGSLAQLESCDSTNFFFRTQNIQIILKLETLSETFNFEFTNIYGTIEKPTGTKKFTCLNLK